MSNEPFDFINQANSDYIDRLQEQYRKNPSSLPEQWRAFFAGFDLGLNRNAGGDASAAGSDTSNQVPLSMGVFDLVHTYREVGHFCANLDPLGNVRPEHPLLNIANFGMTEADLDRQVGQGSFVGKTNGTLRDLIEKLKLTYCGTFGVEFTTISEKPQRDWLQQHIEPSYNHPEFSSAERIAILKQVIQAETFEQFLHTRYIGQKRFSLEGSESLIALLNTVVDFGATVGGEQFIMAMAHRGRLNVLANVVNKPMEVLLGEFEGTLVAPDGVGGDGDVKYHLGYANERSLPEGLKAKISILPNPSHLELINPIQQGIVRAKQLIFGDAGRNRVVPICMHGEAAFTGQGIVSETLNLSELPGFRTGGTIHVILNNQIGFTTSPKQLRFTPYPSDLAKTIQAPIFHVNADDPEAVVHAARLAIGMRQQFKEDVIIDLWSYRRHGHNETDEPSFTQPVMYRKIENHPTVATIYANKLIAEGVVNQAQVDQMRADALASLETSRKTAREHKPKSKIPSFGGVWRGLGRAGADWSAKTQVSRNVLTRIVDSLKNLPEGFTPHPKLAKMLQARIDAVNSGQGIDWGCGEMLALGSLLLEGTPVRFVGQDIERGTFSHRHAVLHDYNNGQTYIPLRNLDPKQGSFVIGNSMLSEFAVFGFEWGYSSADPRNLVIWEAQFGDFVNGAQPMIDQILAAAESKWRYMNGIVMNLPHGYEGQGPEHSNAYVERFLTLCAEDNMQVVIPTTAAQYFHVLRRQILRKFRKPLINMTPKSLLRYEPASSKIEEFTDGSFQLVIDDAAVPEPQNVQRVLMCTGKIYYTLAAARDKQNRKDLAIVRVEQLYPFPTRELGAVLKRYRSAQEFIWVQEEPKNRGAWSFMSQRLVDLLPDAVVQYVGRHESASPATGAFKVHQTEEQQIVAAALGTKRAAPVQPLQAPVQSPD
ncbi:MAG TPA: 2-oxoglutarate dehydrogenase E1 component [Tepidisphaeraceae bacterium]|nr:2-oxoglutarate dehydrogenase E1 component [Tepidisphaeraceae bacterium]